MLDRNSPVPLKRQLADVLVRQIRDEKLTKLPSLRFLMEEYEVSRPTAEAAVKILVDDGLVMVSPGKGTFVIKR